MQQNCCHLFFFFFLVLGGGGLSFCSAHNITKLLSKHPEFATFNQYLSLTHLDADINDRTTITVLAVNNAAMDALISTLHPSIYTLKNILSIHVLLDYFDAKKLHQITDGSTITATLFQTTGLATGTSGFVNITDLQGGKVGFGPNTYFVKSVEESPYNISVLHISNILPSAVAVTPDPGPGDVSLKSIMSGHGCMEFADALSAAPDAFKTFQDSIAGGLTAFCPTDGAFRQFLPKYNNLSAASKASFLEFYGIPTYMSMAMLRSNNGGLTNTLATDGANRFDFTVQKDDGQGIALKTQVNTVKISTTAFDELPLAVYALDGVLLPDEIFKAAAAPAPSPAPVKTAESPKHNSFSSAPAPVKSAESPKHNSFSSAPAPVKSAESPKHKSSIPAPVKPAESPKHNSSSVPAPVKSAEPPKHNSFSSAPAPVNPAESPKHNSFPSAPAPVKPAESPKHKSSSSSSAPDTTFPSESPADSPDGDVADQTASNARVVGDGAAVVMSLLLGFGALLLQPF